MGRNGVRPARESHPVSISGPRFFSLQKDADASALAARNIPDLDREFNDFADTAAATRNLDLVITVDAVIAHLSATLGKETWCC